jgi:hypothetical protein
VGFGGLGGNFGCNADEPSAKFGGLYAIQNLAAISNDGMAHKSIVSLGSANADADHLGNILVCHRVHLIISICVACAVSMQ